MTSDRAAAYARVMKTLRDLGPAKLLPAEQACIRDAADELLLGDDRPQVVLQVLDLMEHLVASERWQRATATALAADVAACGDVRMRLDVVTAA